VSENERKLLGKLHGYRLETGKLFSFTNWLQEAVGSVQATQQEQSRVASLLYEAALRGGLEIGERHPHSILPLGVAPGFDTEIRPPSKDLAIYNPWGFDVMVEALLASGDISISLKGAADSQWKAPRVKVEQQIIKPETIVLADEKATVRSTRQQGRDGLAVTVLCDCLKPEQEEAFSKDIYLPEYFINQEPAARASAK
jgi:hypothetical protein